MEWNKLTTRNIAEDETVKITLWRSLENISKTMMGMMRRWKNDY